jgi:hypothetical protein
MEISTREICFYISQGMADVIHTSPVPKLRNALCEILPQRAPVPKVIEEEARMRLGGMAVVGLFSWLDLFNS